MRGRWPTKRRYEIELLDEQGAVLVATRTGSPTSFLVRRAGVHSTDSWDWVRAADETFRQRPGEWASWPPGP